MLEKAAGLSRRALDAIADLERRVIEADGGRLKLEWGTLRRRSGDRVEDLLWWEGDRLLGFLGFYSFGSSLELAGMVSPDARRRGIATALLDAAAVLCRERDIRKALLIVPRPSEAGKQLALGRGAVLDHSEHALLLSGAPTAGEQDPGIILRPATSVDLPSVSRLLEAAFGDPPPDGFIATFDSPHDRTMVVEVQGSVVGTLRVTQEEQRAGIYGFAVDPAWQGRGIGRDVLRRTCEQLRAEGVQRIGLEVAVENDHALRLYTSIGFTPVITEDYYALQMGEWRSPHDGSARNSRALARNVRMTLGRGLRLRPQRLVLQPSGAGAPRTTRAERPIWTRLVVLLCRGGLL